MTGRNPSLSLARLYGAQGALEIIARKLSRQYKLGFVRVSPRDHIWFDSIKLALFVTTASGVVNQAFDAHTQYIGFPRLMLEREQGEVVRRIEIAIEKKLGIDSNTPC